MFFSFDGDRWHGVRERFKGLLGRRRWLWSSLAGLVLLAIIGGLVAWTIRQNHLTWNPPDPQALFQECLHRTLQAEGFRFSSESKRWVGGREQVFHTIKGEKEGADRFHVSGLLLGSPIEVYMAGRDLIIADPVTRQWHRIKRPVEEQKNIFFEELNPLSVFLLSQAAAPQLLGVETVGEKKALAFDFAATGEGKRVIDQFFKDFRYRLWLDPEAKRILKLQAAALSRNNPGDRMELTVELTDFGKGVQIELPQGIVEDGQGGSSN